MRQNKVSPWPDKQQYNNAEPFPDYVLIKEVENYYECFKCGA